MLEWWSGRSRQVKYIGFQIYSMLSEPLIRASRLGYKTILIGQIHLRETSFNKKCRLVVVCVVCC